MIPLATWAICLAIGVLFWREFTAEGRPTVRPLRMDEEAAQGLYRIGAGAEVARRRHTREATRRHYEGITWPAIQQEICKRETRRRVSIIDAERTLETNRHRASA